MHRALLLLAALTALGFGAFGLFAPGAIAEAVRLGTGDPFAVGERTHAFLLGELAMVAVLGAGLLLARRSRAATE